MSSSLSKLVDNLSESITINALIVNLILLISKLKKMKNYS